MDVGDERIVQTQILTEEASVVEKADMQKNHKRSKCSDQDTYKEHRQKPK